MKRTVVHLVYSLGYGGLEQVIVNLINNSAQYNVQHIIITLTDNQDLYSKIESYVPIYSLDKLPGNDLRSHYRLYKLFKKIKPDAINTYNFGTMEYQLVAFLSGIKTRIHSDHGRGGDDTAGTGFKRNLVRKIVSLMLDKYVVVSPDLLSWGIETLGLGREKIQLIYNGVDTKKYSPGIEKNQLFTLCTVGRADPIKNQSMLIRAYKHVYDKNEEFRNTQLLIVGDGPIFSALEQEVKSLEIDSHIHLLGYRDDISEIMKKSDLFILSSNYEAMPMTVLEAMACELPVICTDVGGTSRLVSEKEGWLVPKNDVVAMANIIEAVFQDKSVLDAKSKLGRKLVEDNYSIEKMVKEYLYLYGLNIT